MYLNTAAILSHRDAERCELICSKLVCHTHTMWMYLNTAAILRHGDVASTSRLYIYSDTYTFCVYDMSTLPNLPHINSHRFVFVPPPRHQHRVCIRKNQTENKGKGGVIERINSRIRNSAIRLLYSAICPLYYAPKPPLSITPLIRY